MHRRDRCVFRFFLTHSSQDFIIYYVCCKWIHKSSLEQSDRYCSFITPETAWKSIDLLLLLLMDTKALQNISQLLVIFLNGRLKVTQFEMCLGWQQTCNWKSIQQASFHLEQSKFSLQPLSSNKITLHSSQSTVNILSLNSFCSPMRHENNEYLKWWFRKHALLCSTQKELYQHLRTTKPFLIIECHWA